MIEVCTDCGANIVIPLDSENGEIIECPDCGLDFVIMDENGKKFLKELAIDGEDWGE